MERRASAASESLRFLPDRGLSDSGRCRSGRQSCDLAKSPAWACLGNIVVRGCHPIEDSYREQPASQGSRLSAKSRAGGRWCPHGRSRSLDTNVGGKHPSAEADVGRRRDSFARVHELRGPRAAPTGRWLPKVDRSYVCICSYICRPLGSPGVAHLPDFSRPETQKSTNTRTQARGLARGNGGEENARGTEVWPPSEAWTLRANARAQGRTSVAEEP